MTKYKNFRRRVYQIITPSKSSDLASLIFDIFICSLTVISCIAVILEIIGTSGTPGRIMAALEHFAVCVFIAEYVIRLWLSDLRYPNSKNKFEAILKFVTSFESFIDIVSVGSIVFNALPSQLALLRLIKIIRLAHAVKLAEHIKISTKAKERIKRIQLRVHQVINRHEKGDRLSLFYDILSVFLIVLSVSFIIIESFHVSHTVHSLIYSAELFIAVFFSIEYVLRIWVSPLEYHYLDHDRARVQYLFSFMSIVDLVAIIPVFVANIPNATGMLKIFKLCKIVRLIKASRYFGGAQEFGKTLQSKKKHILFSVIFNLVLIFVCSFLIFSFESKLQPLEFMHGFSGLQHGIKVIIGTEGDTQVLTLAGRILLPVMLLLIGCLFGVPVTIIATGFEHLLAELPAENADSTEEDAQVNEFMSMYDSLSDAQKEKVIAYINDNDPCARVRDPRSE